MPGKAPRQKGDRLERLAVDILRSYGLDAKRVPLSGAMRGYKGDIVIPISGHLWRLECKARGTGFNLIYKALGEGNQACIIKADRTDPVICMPLRVFAAQMAKVDGNVSRGTTENEALLELPSTKPSPTPLL